VASATKLAAGSGTAFAVGTTAGVVGNNLAEGEWFWAGFVVLTLLGAALSGWLTYRAATPAVGGARHSGDNHIGKVAGRGSGPTVGVNYGHAQGGPGQDAS